MDDFNALGHTVTGLILSILVVDTAMGAAGILFVLFGSLLPDIDHRNSTLGRFNPLTRIRWKKRKQPTGGKKRSKKPEYHTLVKHRGKCHTVAGALLLSLPFLLLGPLAFILVAYGALGHLVADKIHSWLPNKQKFRIKVW